jgi:hypothetical protein
VIAAPASAPVQEPELPAGWRPWPSLRGPRYARRRGDCWADVVESDAGWQWRITRGVRIVRRGGTPLLSSSLTRADRALGELV